MIDTGIFLGKLRETKKALTQKPPDLSFLTDKQKDFYDERLAIMAYEASQEFGKIDETRLSWKVFEISRKK